MEKLSSVSVPADVRIAADGAVMPERFKDVAARVESARRFQSALIFLAMQAGACFTRQDSRSLAVLIMQIKRQDKSLQTLQPAKKKERQKMWQKESGYSNEWSVKITFSTFKRMFGECMNAQGWENVKTEIYGKVCLHDYMIDAAIEGGYGTPKIWYLSRKLPLRTARRRKGGDIA